jgi:hypothetical protein
MPFVEVPSKRRSSMFNLIRSLFKPWFPVRLQKRPPLRATVLSQRTHIHAGSLGRVRGQVEFFQKVRRAPLATATTRTPYVIYLDNRSKISKADYEDFRETLDNSASTMIHEQDHHRDPTLILLLAPGTPSWSSLQSSHVG